VEELDQLTEDVVNVINPVTPALAMGGNVIFMPPYF
jgi:hypothetical protein